MTVYLIAFLFLFAVIRACQPTRRPAVVPVPDRWPDFLHSPVPLVVEDVDLRGNGDPADTVTVYNRSAAMLRMNRYAGSNR